MDQHIIAFETSSRVCEVALLSVVQGRRQLRSLSHDGTPGHAEQLLPMARQLLDEAGVPLSALSAVAFGQGPGGFTGLRVACGVAQGVSFSLGIPVVPVVSLHAAAATATGPDAIRVVVQDARMNEVYVAAYRCPEPVGTGLECLAGPILAGVDDFPVWLGQMARQWRAGEHAGPVCVMGDALVAYPGLVFPPSIALADGVRPLRMGEPVRATAAAVADLAAGLIAEGAAVSPEAVAPLYVRDKVAFTTLEREQGMGGNPRASGLFALQPMTSVHLDAVVDLEARVQSHPWTPGNFSDALAAGYSAWVALDARQQVAGFCVVQLAPDVAHLLLIAVTPDLQRAGLGHRLLHHAESVAREAGLPAVLLEVRPSNQKAVNFYTNRGYRQVGLRKGYYPNGNGPREDALVLQKTVSEGVA